MADASVDPPRARMVKIKPQDKALKFSGGDIEQFLDDYELAAELDGASDYDKARQVGSFVETGEIRAILATLEGYKPPDWNKLKTAMTSYWGDVDKALFTERDIVTLVEKWSQKGGISSVSDYHEFHTRSSAPVASPFQASNEIMKRMGEDRRPSAPTTAPKADPSMDELTKMLKAFEQYMKQDPGRMQGERPPLICYYCHRERHGTARCLELQKDKDEGLVEQRGTNFFLPNGALIPFDRSRPIRHVVASYQPSTSAAPPRPSTPTRQTSSAATAEYKTGCGSLHPWYPPAVGS
ncbi:hypothetical protein PTTG_06821 [Puccinia triticina 1-1 BBBD Race 1]|uniref:CCHC-type domain-containing protein n=1 Tax=Puccinia triticina (isolate 1-1 / race 1 (BBBD)) TaxID=630390 RepID=A0A0C4F151_PUCT1|nr:hypothetical protein PTTG_06821 [Puccinia triticina 1-1 BBBD Race 1]